jgi:hypothetical protein
MKLLSVFSIPFLVTAVSSQLLVRPFARNPASSRGSDQSKQQPLQMASDPEGPTTASGVMLSDVMGRDRSINMFASFTRDVPAIAGRLDDAARNSTILAPRNSAIDGLPRKPWEDPADYTALGAAAYDGDGGRERAQRNLARFVEAHVVPASPWAEGDRLRTLLGDREVWWETRDDGKRVVRMPAAVCACIHCVCIYACARDGLQRRLEDAWLTLSCSRFNLTISWWTTSLAGLETASCGSLPVCGTIRRKCTPMYVDIEARRITISTQIIIHFSFRVLLFLFLRAVGSFFGNTHETFILESGISHVQAT